ncbi:phage baseplate assembly protein V [Lachnospiraceae bacterium ZAX-1]
MGMFEGVFENNGTDVNKIYSVTTGIVKENWEAEHPGMVKVEIFLGEDGKNLTGWVPVATIYGGTEFGAYTLPEIGAEVIVAFNMGDRNCPIVIGSLWNNQNKLPPETANEKNTIKKFKTKGGCEVTFSEESGKESIEIKTPGEMKILLNDEKKMITVSDKDAKNAITLDCDKGTMTLAADKKLECKVGGESALVIDGSAKSVAIESNKITLNGKQGLELKGQSLKVEGSMVEIKGQSTLKIESSAMAEIKGAMVKIN